MEIVFVYIEQYKSIYQQEFNLNGEYLFSFDKSKKIIHFKKNPKFIPEYYTTKNPFTSSSINNVRAIVGQNGSGKSSLIEFLGQLFRGFDNFNTAYSIDQDLVITRQGEKLSLYYKNNVFKAKLNNDEGSIKIPKKIKASLEGNEKNNSELKASIIPMYYSTSMYDRFVELGIQDYDLVDVSNAYCYYITGIPVHYDKIRKSSHKRVIGPSNFKYEDAIRQLTFLHANETMKMVPVLFETYGYFGISVRQQFSNNDKYKEIFILLYQKYRPENDIEFLKLQIITSVLLGFIFPDRNHLPEDFLSNTELFEIFQKTFDRDYSLTLFINAFLSNHPLRNTAVTDDRWGMKIELYNFRVPEKIEFLRFIDTSFTISNFREAGNIALQNFDKSSERNAYFNPYNYYYKIEAGKKFCQLYLDQLEELTPDFLEIKWGDLSSGQIAFLNLFSRFYDGFERYKKFHNIGDNLQMNKNQSILILIDEGEVFFHPQWQKEYLKLLITFFEKLFYGISVHLIIATNSPFITSDIPSYDITFLEKDANQNTKKSISSDHCDTLGANIHKLFKDAFYLQNGFMGEFAKLKIQEIIDLLNLSQKQFQEISTSEKKYILKLIENLGEPVLKEKLLEMYSELTI